MKTLQRKALHADIWSRPATKIAAELGISSSALKKICIKMEIPTPVAGYWAKVAAGKGTRPKSLPKASPQCPNTWDLDLTNSKAQKRASSQRSKVVSSIQESQKKEPIHFEKDPKLQHRLVRNTRIRLSQFPDYTPATEKRSHLHVSVSEGSRDRALMIADALVRQLVHEGMSLKEEPEKDHRQHARPYVTASAVLSHSEYIHFSIKESNRRVPLKVPPTYSWQKKWEEKPSGILTLQIDGGWNARCRTKWKDGKVQRVEDFVHEAVATFPIVARNRIEARERQEAKEQRRKRLAEQEREMKWQAELESRLLNRTTELSNGLAKAQALRSIAEAFQPLLEHLPTIEKAPNDPHNLWIRWIHARADLLDPLLRETPPWEEKVFKDLFVDRPESARWW